MKNRLITLLIFLVFTIIGLQLWPYISIPVNINNLSEVFINPKNLTNPINDPLRFLTLLSLPFFALIILFQIRYKIFLKNFFLVLNFNQFFKSKSKYENQNEINIYTLLILLILLLEFFSLNFSEFDHQLDFFHEGLWLTAAQNLNLSGNIWTSSYVARGFFGDFYPFFLWEIFNKESIGVTRFFKLFIFFLNKILLLFIARKLCFFLKPNKDFSTIYFLLLSASLLAIQGYINPVFLIRSFLLLFFILITLNFLQNYNKDIFYLPILGLFSSLSFFWYIDIGIYVNLILLIFIIYFLYKRDSKKLIFFILLILLGWAGVYLAFPKNEFIQFIVNTKTILGTLGWVGNFDFPIPFLSSDARSSKAILLFLVTGYLIIRSINFLDKDKALFLLSIGFLYLVSLTYFNYGLGRSDGGHIRIATGMIFIPFFSIIIFLMMEKLANLFKKRKNLMKYLKLPLFLIIFVTTLFINKQYESKSLNNISKSKTNIQKLINYKDNQYIGENHLELVSKFRELSENEKCTFIFTNEVALYYLLKRPSCSKHYLMWKMSYPKQIQENLIKDLEKEKPKYIIFKSDVEIFIDSSEDLEIITDYLNFHYSFYKNISDWQINVRN